MTLEEIESTYGDELAREIKNNIKISEMLGIDHRIEIIEQGQYVHTIAFATRSYVYLFEVFAEKKLIIDMKKIGYSDCQRALEIMDELENVGTKLNISRR